MANVFVGFQNNQKNCRRSLKPPGGGTSDFFNFGTIIDEPKKPEITTQMEKKKEDESYHVEQVVILPKKDLEVKKDNMPTDDQICETLNDMTVDQICEIEESEDELNKDSALTKITEKNYEELKNEAATDKSTNATTTTKSSITMNSTTTRKELTSEKQSFSRVPPGGHSKGLW